MEATISFDLVSPEQLVFNDKAGMIIVPGKEGDIGAVSYTHLTLPTICSV